MTIDVNMNIGKLENKKEFKFQNFPVQNVRQQENGNFLKLETSFGQDLSFLMEETCFESWLLGEENKTDWKKKENLEHNYIELTTM